MNSDSPVTSTVSVSVAGVGASDVAFLKVQFAAALENINVKTIVIQGKGYATATNPADFASVTLWDGATQIGSAQTLSNMASTTFNLTPETYWTIPAGFAKYLTVKASLNGIRSPYTSGAVTGDTPLICLEELTAAGASSGAAPTGCTTDNCEIEICSSGQVIRQSQPTIALTAPTAESYGAGTKALIKWTVTADAKGAIGWRKMVFDVSGGVTINGLNYTIGSAPSTTDATYTFPANDGIYMSTSTSFASKPVSTGVYQLIATSSMYVWDDSAGAQVTTGRIFVDQATATGTARVSFIADTEQVIAAGASKVYTFWGNILKDGTAGSALMTKIDSRAVSTSTGAWAEFNNITDATSTLIWTDRSGGSAAAHSDLTSDWTNSYKIVGLPTTAKTLSK